MISRRRRVQALRHLRLSRSTSRPTSPASAASRSTSPASSARWTSSASARAPRASSPCDHGARRARSTQKTRVHRLRTLAGRGRVVALIKGEHRVRVPHAGRGGRRRPRPHAVLRRGRRPGRRRRRARARRACEFAVTDTQKIRRGARAHRRCSSSGASCASATSSRPTSTRARRAARPCSTTPRRTSCTRRCARVLGEHVQQKGSLVAPDRLRFDFSHYEPMTPDADRRDRGARERRDPRATPTPRSRVMATTTRSKAGAMALFGEKYGDAACACCASAISRWSSAAARTCSARATSALFKITPRAASPPACAASRR